MTKKLWIAISKEVFKEAPYGKVKKYHSTSTARPCLDDLLVNYNSNEYYFIEIEVEE